MPSEVYRELCETMAKRGGMYPGVDIPEFYEVAEELFTPDEAAVANAMPQRPSTPRTIAEAMGRKEVEVERILEGMADKGLCLTTKRSGVRHYVGPPFVPGIFEYQFMRGTSTDRDRKLAKLILAYKKAYDSKPGGRKVGFPNYRVIAIDQTIPAGTQVHTYEQMMEHVERNELISLATCYCRHAAKLADENDDCGKPNEVCMAFGKSAEYIVERGIGRKVSKVEARDVVRTSAEAGLVHCTRNAQEIDFLCNCCPDHCIIIKEALSQPKPGLVLRSGFQPSFDADLCSACEACVEQCPATALTMCDDDVPEPDMDRCFGCGVCATVCPTDAIQMGARAEPPVPPANLKALGAAMKDHAR
jgi:Pyruvate/2-oxoacid:ferredoxin oxidoreductase delta subunit